jgi:hypothetical protein
VTLASAFGSVHDFFHSSTWYVIRNLAVFFVLVFWVASVYWVYKDGRRRIADPLLVWVATLLGVVPFIGPLIYMLFRPPEYIEDVRERELEIKAMEKRLGGRDLHCPVCRAEIEEARAHGIDDVERIFTIDDLAPQEVIVAATGVSNGDLLRGVRFLADSARTHSLVMCTRCNWVRFVDGIHFFARERREEVRLS